MGVIVGNINSITIRSYRDTSRKTKARQSRCTIGCSKYSRTSYRCNRSTAINFPDFIILCIYYINISNGIACDSPWLIKCRREGRSISTTNNSCSSISTHDSRCIHLSNSVIESIGYKNISIDVTSNGMRFIKSSNRSGSITKPRCSHTSCYCSNLLCLQARTQQPPQNK